ncbi:MULTISPECIES: hypothetical protein [Streptomyces]|uniref:SH3 domain-containing protein n=2 Tax=Streptomyces TaxID=1883 RepID=A0ABS9JW28_9ACTN|nr:MULTISPECIES: hypothetical protein [Streptomyces]MYU28462.1 hypothetical protein [Streptomyces sp. SID7810]CUW29489.1 hypothetical protein TUE45_04198 [Streptomyces reticuli]MCE0445740.1 hypothetical protein [Streptomyces tricolor]MCG0069755.1 hypothetical protein [Streptomyces tricolor]BCM67685.1 hypothetical protein EASAB2608_03019 [Streptomyces sp. EAS-AB2608]
MAFSKLPLRKAVSGLTAATALAVTATLMAAPSASAANPRGCKNIADQTRQITRWGDTVMRSGPGENYKKKKVLFTGDTVRVYCRAYKSGTYWYYGKNGKTKGYVDEYAF